MEEKWPPPHATLDGIPVEEWVKKLNLNDEMRQAAYRLAHKGNKSCDEWGHWPIKKPVVPAFMPEPGPRIDPANLPEEWIGFVSPE